MIHEALTYHLHIDGMKCARGCAQLIQETLNHDFVDNIRKARVHFPSKSATVELEPTSPWDLPDLIDCIASIGPKGKFTATADPNVSPPLVLTILGMNCDRRCAKRVRQTLARLPSVKSVSVSFEHKLARVVGHDSGFMTLTRVDIIRAVRLIAPRFDACTRRVAQESEERVASEPRRIITFDLIVSSSSSSSNSLDIATCAELERGLNENCEGVLTACVDKEERTALVTLDPATRISERDIMSRIPTFCPKKKISATVKTGRTSEDERSRRRRRSSSSVTDQNQTTSLEGGLHTGKSPRDTDDPQKKPSSRGTTTPVSKKIQKITLLIGGMTCNSCANSVQRALDAMPGVDHCVVNFATEKANIWIKTHSGLGVRDIVEHVESIGYAAQVMTEDESKNQSVGEDQRLRAIASWRNSFYVSLLFTFPIILIMTVFGNIRDINAGLVTEVLPGLTFKALSILILVLPVQFYSASSFHHDAYAGLKNGRVGMPFLVSMGTNASFFYGLLCSLRALSLHNPDIERPDFYMTTSMLVTFVLLGKYMESIATRKTSEAMSKLLHLKAKTAILVHPSSSSSSCDVEDVRVDSKPSNNVVEEDSEEVAIEWLQRGDVVKVVRGASVPADGRLTRGSGRVDESMLTGESNVVKKEVGDHVFGASINTEGLFYMEITGVGSDTVLSQIVRLVEDAQTSKAPIQAYADVVASRFVPTVVVTSVLTFIVWYLGLHWGFISPTMLRSDDDSAFTLAFNFAIATLVVACPCALGLATPTAVMVGTGVGADHGILIKGGEPLEVAHSIDTVVFDKTGTLTAGTPVVTDVHMLERRTSSSSSSSLDVDECIYLAASAELGSEHILGKALVDYAKILARPLTSPSAFEAVSGRGIRSTIERQLPSSGITSSNHVTIGNFEWMVDEGILPLDESNSDSSSVVSSIMHEFEQSGKTGIYMAVNQVLVAVFGIADAPRQEAFRAIDILQNQLHLDVWMATGDNFRTAQAIAKEVGIKPDHVLAAALPEQKALKVQELQQKAGKRVCFIGDGINDSIALAQADLGMSIGGGTEVAIETADMVLMKGNLLDVVTAIDLSRTIFQRIRWNYIWAMGYNCMLIPLAAGILYPYGVHIPPMFAGGAMALSSVSVVMSSLSLRLYSPPNYFQGSLGSDSSSSSSSPRPSASSSSPRSGDDESTPLLIKISR